MSWLIILWCINAVSGIVLSTLLLIFRRKFSIAHWASDNKNDKVVATPAVTVVIAARNEEHTVGRTLQEFAALPGVDQIILVDDGSEDNTLQIARSVAADNYRIRVLEAPPLPPGWIGKTHAIHWASQFVETEFILFTDADVHIEHMPLRDITARMDRDALDHVGGNFRLDISSFSEALIGPVFATVAFIALGLVASRHGAGSGAFNLVRTSSYRRVNGHSMIRGHVVDDVALAQLFQKERHRSHFLDTSPAISVHLFEGFRGLYFALSRWSILLSRLSACLALICSIFILVLNGSLVFAPLVLLDGHNVLNSGHSLHACTPAMIFLGAYLWSVLPFVLAGSLHSRSRCWGFISPVGLIMMAGAVSAATIRLLLAGEIRWRGRSYRHILYSGKNNNYKGESKHEDIC